MTETKIVHIFRHGEVRRGHDVVDPPLTPLGREATYNLIDRLPPSVKAPTLVVVSPLKRCVETALFGFHRHFNRRLDAAYKAENKKDRSEVFQHFLNGNITFMLDPRLQEVGQTWEPRARNKMPSRREMEPYYRKYFIFPEEFYPKYTEGQEDDPDKDQDWYNEEGMWCGRLRSANSLERAASFKEFLYNRPEQEIIVVTSNAFSDTLVHEPYTNLAYLESRSCMWKPTISGRMRLVPFFFPESRKDVVPDEDYSECWPYRQSERSKLFNKWYRSPTKMYEALLLVEEWKKYLGLNEMTLAGLETELGPKAADEMKMKAKEWVKNGTSFEIRCPI